MQSNCNMNSKMISEHEKLSETSTLIKQNIKTLMSVLDTKLIELYNEPSLENLPSPNDFSKAIESTLNCVFRNKTDIQNELKYDISSIDYIPSKNRKLYSDRFLMYRNKVAKAANSKQIFSISGPQSQISKSLKKRGWIEKLTKCQLCSIQMVPQNALLMFAAPGNNFENVILSKLAQMHTSNFQWQWMNSKEKLKVSSKNEFPYRNRIQFMNTLNFTNKDGLIECIGKVNLNTKTDTEKYFAPRSYRLNYAKNNMVFFKDYRTTACISFLKFINDENDRSRIFSESGTLPLSLLVFALEKLRFAINIKQKYNQTTNNRDQLLGEDNLWEYFCNSANALINKKEQLKFNNKTYYEKSLESIAKIIEESNKYWPHTVYDGYLNLWILKPSNSCKGQGISITYNYADILQATQGQNKTFIVQKYIERPLLIYNTKFDIRQHILITITSTKFNIWMYKDCYLRFSSQEYKLNNLDNSIHLTNIPVQKKFKTCRRSVKLPQHNMWSLDQFKEHLKYINRKNDIWLEKIYSTMKKTCIKIILSCLESIHFIPKTFELYGCDFIIDENFVPYLIEINSSPDMSHSTIVTAKICPEILEDLIKVVIDLPKNPNVNIGKFELIHSINWKELHMKPIYSSEKFIH